MGKNKIYKKIRDYSYFIWLILLISVATITTNFYDSNKKNQTNF